MKQICGYCLEQFEGKYCDCNDGVKRTFFSDEIDFTMLAVDKPVCECGTVKFNFYGRKEYGNRTVLNFKCANCDKVLGAETFFPNKKPFPTNPREGSYLNLLEEIQQEEEIQIKEK